MAGVLTFVSSGNHNVRNTEGAGNQGLNNLTNEACNWKGRISIDNKHYPDDTWKEMSRQVKCAWIACSGRRAAHA